MSEGIHTSDFYEDSGTYHTTSYDDDGRHSFDWDPLTGDVTGDHYVSNENQDEKTNYEDSNMWDDLEAEGSLDNVSDTSDDD